MPLARILTFDPGDAADFAQQLQQMGFQVEIVSPNERPIALAELEIEFAICDQQQVLGRASAIAAQLQAQVVVFPGAIPPLPKPIVAPESYEPLLPKEYLREEPEAAREQPVHESIDEDPAFKPATEPEMDGSSIQVTERLRAGWQRLRVELARAGTMLKTAASSAASAVARDSRAFQHRIQLRIAHLQAAWEQRLVEFRRRRENAAQRAATLQQERQRQAELAVAAREQERQRQAALAATQEQELQQQATLATAAQQQEILRLQKEKEKLLVEVERLRLEARDQPAAPVEAQPQPPGTPVRPALQPMLQKAIKAMQQGNGHLRGAFAGAIAATILFLVGMIGANFHGMTPLSHSLGNAPIEEQVPFGATTVHGAPGVTLEPVPVKNPPPPSAPSLAKPDPAKPGPAKNSGPPPKPDPQWHHFQRAANDAANDHEGDIVAQDVVVRHFGTPRRPPAQTAQQQGGIKRYSDE